MQVLGIGFFRVYYSIERETEGVDAGQDRQIGVRIEAVEPAPPDSEIELTKTFDPESAICARFLERFPRAKADPE